MADITLYTKAGCTLCDHVKAYLEQRSGSYPHRLVEVDITKDQDTFARYRFIIPVVEIGESRLKAPITTMQLEQALQQLNK